MKKQLCFLVIFLFFLSSFAQKPGEWKWVHGSSTFNATGIYGTKGIAAPANTPGAREQCVEWRDTSGNLWLFSGTNASSAGAYTDLWKFDPKIEQWTFMHGSTIQSYGAPVYGTIGIAAAGNTPNWTTSSPTAVDKNNNLWLYASGGEVWKFDVSTNMWTCIWVRPTPVTFFKVGPKGVFLPTNNPGVVQRNAAGWIDKNDHFWIYVNTQDNVQYKGPLLWEFDPLIKQWAWRGGDTTVFRPKTVGKGIASPINVPGATNVYARWSDSATNLWMMSASYYNTAGYPLLQAMWKYDITSNQFTWVGGDTAADKLGVYGTKSVPAASNWPGGRFDNRAAWKDKCGNFWIFGGNGLASTSAGGAGLNDLWVYSPKLGQWMWKGGANNYSTSGSYGTKGVYSAANQPPGRKNAVGWEDKEGNFWIFGGGGSSGTNFMNDLWKLYTLPEVTTKPAYCNAQDGTGTVDAFLGFPPYTYTWSNGTTTVTSTSATTTGLPSGFYTVNIVDAAGCIQMDTATVHRNDTTLNAKPTTTPAACGNSNGTASVTFGGGTSPFTYTWSSSSGSTYNTQNVSGLASGLYTITINDKGNCSYSDTISVLLTNAPTVTLKPTNTPCGSTTGSAVATVTGAVTPYVYSWSSGSTTASISNVGAGIYSLTVTDNVGCKQTVSTTVKANGSLSATISSNSVIDCYGDKTGSASITVSSGSGKSPYTYSWSTNVYDTLSTLSNVSGGTYTVVVTDNTGCTVLKTITLKQPTQITAITSTTPSDCGVSNGSASVTASGGTTGYTYVWNTTETTSTITNVATGMYTVAIADSKNCTVSATASISENNSLAVFAGIDTTILEGETIVLNASSATSSVTYSWSVLSGDNNSLSCISCVDPNVTPKITSTYIVSIDQNGCKAHDTISVFVDIKCSDEVFLPTAFSPNYDGVNDVFKIRANKSCVKDLLLQVFDRWGEKVFETNDINIGWNGVYRGQELNSSVFIYKLVYTSTTSGNTSTLKGNVTLIK